MFIQQRIWELYFCSNWIKALILLLLRDVTGKAVLVWDIFSWFTLLLFNPHFWLLIWVFGKEGSIKLKNKENQTTPVNTPPSSSPCHPAPNLFFLLHPISSSDTCMAAHSWAIPGVTGDWGSAQQLSPAAHGLLVLFLYSNMSSPGLKSLQVLPLWHVGPTVSFLRCVPDLAGDTPL